jgi:hypothetical protein
MQDLMGQKLTLLMVDHDRNQQDQHMDNYLRSGKKGLMNLTLQMELDCIYDDLDFSSEMAAVELESNGLYMLYDVVAKKIIWTEGGTPQ